MSGFLPFSGRFPPSGAYNAGQAALLETAQAIFIFNQVAIFPLYYVPGVRCLLGGDGEAKFPCSISWMTRKGLPRFCTVTLWNLGWMHMLRSAIFDGDLAAMTAADWLRGARARLEIETRLDALRTQLSEAAAENEARP